MILLFNWLTGLFHGSVLIEPAECSLAAISSAWHSSISMARPLDEISSKILSVALALSA